jgi:hypothetical protein
VVRTVTFRGEAIHLAAGSHAVPAVTGLRGIRGVDRLRAKLLQPNWSSYWPFSLAFSVSLRFPKPSRTPQRHRERKRIPLSLSRRFCWINSEINKSESVSRNCAAKQRRQSLGTSPPPNLDQRNKFLLRRVPGDRFADCKRDQIVILDPHDFTGNDIAGVQFLAISGDEDESVDFR